jgi:hypothetical protein
MPGWLHVLAIAGFCAWLVFVLAAANAQMRGRP